MRQIMVMKWWTLRYLRGSSLRGLHQTITLLNQVAAERVLGRDTCHQ